MTLISLWQPPPTPMLHDSTSLEALVLKTKVYFVASMLSCDSLDTTNSRLSVNNCSIRVWRDGSALKGCSFKYPAPTMEHPNPLPTSMNIRHIHGTHIHAGKNYIKLNKQNQLKHFYYTNKNLFSPET